MRKFKCSSYQKRALEFLKPPENITVSQWAEKNRILDDKTSNISGSWNNSVTPYLIGVMDEFNSAESEEIVFIKPTQVGGTETLHNMIGYIINQNPASTLVVYPTEGDAEKVSDTRIRPMLEICPQLKKHYKANDSQKLQIQLDNMFLFLAGSNSPSGLASQPIRYLFLDEIDKYPGASKKEADPIKLAKERTKTFKSNKKIFMTSTPTLKSGHIWKEKESADIEKHYFVPCPHCNEMIELKFKQISYKENEELSIADKAASAYYVCQECGSIIYDRDKPIMLKNGEWRIVKGETLNITKVAFWINTLYSPFVSFAQIIKEYLDCKDDDELMQNFYNSWLAEPWENTKLKTSDELVMERETNLEQFILPQWTKILTGGIDVQENGLYWSIRAWGNFLTSQNIAHGYALSFAEIEKIMNLEYQKQDGTRMLVDKVLMDSGDQTDEVYEFCLMNQEWVLPCKGSSNPMQSHYKISIVNKKDSKAIGIPLVIIDTDKYKDMIASRMTRPNGKGSWMVYKGCDKDYAKQVTAEQKVIEGKKEIWKKKTTHADNHYLDCEVYTFCAADLLNVRMLYLTDEPDYSKSEEEQYTQEEQWIQQNENWI